METKVKSASVKVMLSYDYSHFEASMSLENDEGLTTKEIDESRKSCQRLTLKAVEQYKKYKQNASLRTDGQYKITAFENECKRIETKAEGDRTLNEIAMLKQYHDENWREQFEYNYDFDDDEDYNI
jgi:hypothetical protein